MRHEHFPRTAWIYAIVMTGENSLCFSFAYPAPAKSRIAVV
jgi:hypothetical protein